MKARLSEFSAWAKERCVALYDQIKKHIEEFILRCKKKTLSVRDYMVCGCIALVLLFVLVMYGPFKGLSDLYITTAMHTSDHKWLAQMLYTDDYIHRVLDRNSVKEMEGVSHEISSPIDGERSTKIRCIEINERGFSGFLLVVSDPARIDIVSAGEHGGMLVEEIAHVHDAVAAINASGYISKAHTETPNGMVIYDHRLIHECDSDRHSYFAIDDNNTLVFGVQSTQQILDADYRCMVDFGPLLILNGKLSEISGYGTGLSARTAIGQTSSGEVLMLVIDGMQTDSLGATLSDVQNIMLEHGAVNAISLDGGSSSSMYYNGKVMNEPSQGMMGRVIPNAIVVR